LTEPRLGATTSKLNAGGRRTSFRQQPIPLARLAHLRENAYRALSQSLLSPTEDVASLAGSLLSEWTSDPSLPGEFPFSTDLLRLHSVWAGMDQQDLKQLKTRYVALFVAATGGIPCPPYESTYLAGNPGDEGHVLAAIERDYATVGLYLSPEQKQSPDHISMELEFMAILCGREADAWESKEPTRAVRLLEKESRFLDQHIGLWLPALVRDIETADADGAYSTIGATALAFVTHDRDLCDELAHALPADEESAK
jgi:TorA maturation chaperone TorD